MNVFFEYIHDIHTRMPIHIACWCISVGLILRLRLGLGHVVEQPRRRASFVGRWLVLLLNAMCLDAHHDACCTMMCDIILYYAILYFMLCYVISYCMFMLRKVKLYYILCDIMLYYVISYVIFSIMLYHDML